MSRDMILSSAEIDSTGNFAFDLGFLPEAMHLFRLHIVKNGDSPTTLIIGGKNENHMFFLASGNSRFTLRAMNGSPPFSNVLYEGSAANRNIQLVTDLVSERSNIAAESDAAKRRFIENDLQNQLAIIADSTSDHLLGLYAIYRMDNEINYATNPELYESFLLKWKDVSNPYLETFRNKLPATQAENSSLWQVALGILLLVLGFIAGRWAFRSKRGGPNISTLSIQERKVFDLLRKGASNQDIADECNIGISTVKSHVSSIYSKLNLKSRKDVMNLQ